MRRDTDLEATLVATYAIRCAGLASDPLVPFAPNLDFRFTIDLSFSAHGIEYTITGCHDSFPDYEIWINNFPALTDAASGGLLGPILRPGNVGATRGARGLLRRLLPSLIVNELRGQPWRGCLCLLITPLHAAAPSRAGSSRGAAPFAATGKRLSTSGRGGRDSVLRQNVTPKALMCGGRQADQPHGEPGALDARRHGHRQDQQRD